jgi:cytochrome P450
MTSDEATATASTGAAGGRAGGLGEEFDPLLAHGQDPYSFYARARAEAPVFYSSRFDLWFVTRYDDVAAILRDPQTFSSAESIPQVRQRAPEVAEIMRDVWPRLKSLVNIDPPEHTRLRRIAREGFTPARVAALEPMIREVAEGLIDHLGDGPADLLSQFAYPMPLTVILRVLGVPLADLEQCRAWTQDLLTERDPGDLPLGTRLAAARGALEFCGYCGDLVAERAAEPRADLISHLLTARVPGLEPLSPQQVADLLPSFILAGHETTANLIGNLVWRLLHHPDQLAAVRSDPALLPGAVEEALRYDPPALGFIRTARHEVEIAGTTIPEGGRLFLAYASANHDGGRFPDPEAFRADRDGTTRHFAFGLGIHFCLGAPLARLEARVALERLLVRLPGMRLADPAAPPRWRPNLLFRGLDRLVVAWDATPPRGV